MKYGKISGLWVSGGAESSGSSGTEQSREKQRKEKQRKNSDIITQINIGVGIINPDYQGELKVVMINNSTTLYEVQTGDKITQLIMENAETPEVVNVTNLTQTERGEEGFRSTDMTEELAEIFEIKLGHTHSSKLQPEAERLASI